MTERFYPPFQRFFTTDLKTLPGALLYFYENGTTTPKTVYRDPFKNNAHANPVVAGTHGAAADTFPAIFLDGTYTIELRSSAGVVQSGWPVDNVGGEQVEGQFDSWSSIVSYSIGDIVTASNGLRFISLQNSNLNREPTISPAWWDEFRITLDWNALSDFAINDRVFYAGSVYVSLQSPNVNQTPSSSSAYWKLVDEEFEWNPTTTYAANAIVKKAGVRYKSLAGSNLNNDPAATQAFWQEEKVEYKWNAGITYGSGDYVFDGNTRYISKQAANVNHQPSTDTAETWWKPDWQAFPPLTTVQTLTGGGALTPYTANEFTDASTYTLPLASTVPSGGFIIAGKSETFKGNQPIVSRAGSDNIRYNGGTDTSVRFTLNYGHSLRFKSNGSNEWSI